MLNGIFSVVPPTFFDTIALEQCSHWNTLQEGKLNFGTTTFKTKCEVAIKAPQLTGTAGEHLPGIDTKDKNISVFAGDVILVTWLSCVSCMHTPSQEIEVR